ncbi:4-hydroxy-tetrahydrodipicolinate synthase [Sporomusa acidovorans]|uniref:4-hydroxy-tetrahydrodipicolinate synthase n=1 Tax=Sporomusa acidovorans (strain ATCC 49682 / DSM 3132 / Mol) TaxID=1123286 RepID=A0ABZ3J2P6_SPOA4|nr:4-hydroxy-tetrahydrodipicolinate synthase [Sporomusa acidovorans]OZC20129.1 4-hydroxy-tetrahydrodipicolinate synthase [Sporomusa acidovorans DSM 3132]SDD44277.1 4-hydroxy-tetrahydrodipicolinate synthase [Sporomusa acidovorans]
MKKFGRVLTAMVTPFNADYSVNYSEAAKLADYLVNNGSDGLVVAGSTGEAATLTTDEKLSLFKVVLEAVGDKATVIAGTGSNDTRASIKLTQEAEKIGVHGAMLVGPYYNKPPQEGYYQHFKSIANSTDLPLIVYNVPGRTASNILPSTIARLAEIDNIVAVKEASGNLDQVSEIIRTTPAEFLVYSGDDGLTLPILSVGGSGVISVAAHVVGKRMQEMVTAFFAGDMNKAQTLHLELMPFFKVIFITTNPIPIKEAVNIIGIHAGPTRLPLIPPTDQETEQLKKVMQSIGII